MSYRNYCRTQEFEIRNMELRLEQRRRCDNTMGSATQVRHDKHKNPTKKRLSENNNQTTHNGTKRSAMAVKMAAYTAAEHLPNKIDSQETRPYGTGEISVSPPHAPASITG